MGAPPYWTLVACHEKIPTPYNTQYLMRIQLIMTQTNLNYFYHYTRRQFQTVQFFHLLLHRCFLLPVDA